MFQIISCTKFHFPDKFMEIRSRVSVMLLLDKQTHKPTEMKP